MKKIRTSIRPSLILAALGVAAAAVLGIGVQSAAAGDCTAWVICGVVSNESDTPALVAELDVPGGVPCILVNAGGAHTCKSKALPGGQSAGGSYDQIGMRDVDALRFPRTGFYIHFDDGTSRYVPHDRYLKIPDGIRVVCRTLTSPAAAPRCVWTYA